MEKHFCDRCGKEMGSLEGLLVKYENRRYQFMLYDSEARDSDVCQACQKIILARGKISPEK